LPSKLEIAGELAVSESDERLWRPWGPKRKDLRRGRQVDRPATVHDRVAEVDSSVFAVDILHDDLNLLMIFRGTNSLDRRAFHQHGGRHLRRLDVGRLLRRLLAFRHGRNWIFVYREVHLIDRPSRYELITLTARRRPDEKIRRRDGLVWRD